MPDYRGVPVLSAYNQLDVDESRWAIMAEMDRDEVAEIAAGDRPPLGGALLLIYGLSLWSAWYWRGRQLPEQGGDLAGLGEAEASGGSMFEVDSGGGSGFGE